jgi:23S rRNA (cytosine1962-C5)-methyltransferase
MLIADDWKDYELIDAGDGERLERWGEYILRRPDPQAMWHKSANSKTWEGVHALYHRSDTGGGNWEFLKNLPERWKVRYGDLSFYVKPTGFKHMGLFPEQSVNWKWLIEKIQASKGARVLNLFSYTGGATVAAASAGAEVCHVDAAKGIVKWAKENLELSGLASKPVRFIVDDAIKFVQREKRRGKEYEAVIMDPPSYGRGPKGEMWKIEDELYNLVEMCASLLSQKPLFFLINSYTTGLSPTVLKNVLELIVRKKFGGKVASGEVGLPITSSGLVLPCGIFCRWESD